MLLFGSSFQVFSIGYQQPFASLARHMQQNEEVTASSEIHKAGQFCHLRPMVRASAVDKMPQAPQQCQNAEVNAGGWYSDH